MAGSTVLERTTEKSAEKTTQVTQTAEMSVEEKQHNERKADYLKLLYSDEEPEVEVAPAAAPSSAAQRLADYKAYAAPSTRHILFDGVTYKDGELISESAVKAPEAKPAYEAKAEVYTAPAYAAQAEVLPAPALAPSEDDALPTRRTMDTLRQPAVETGAMQRTGLFAGVSTRTIIALAAIVFTVIMAIVVICINTGIINSLDAHISTLREEVLEEQMKYEELELQKEQIQNFEGPIQDLVKEFAESKGMIRG